MRNVITDTCVQLMVALQAQYMPAPTTEMFSQMAEGYQRRWQLPNACLAIDGKHIRIQKPKKSGSKYFNYKKFFSIVLLAACESNYKFVLWDIGAYGSSSDGGVLSQSMIGQKLINRTLGIPPPKALPNGGVEIPHYMIGDEAFPLSDNIMRPYPGLNLTDQQEHFNYRISRARMTIEISFGK